jgi:hypothetical protein
VQGATPRVLSRASEGADKLLQLAETFFVIRRDDLAENLKDLLDECHRVADQERISHNRRSKQNTHHAKSRLDWRQRSVPEP